jgi:NAD(P)-dependent dehydrogenase (short-subunit alcohol dehydrogenase family)
MNVAVVTGGNRGIGFEICRQLAARGLHVVLTARDEAAAHAACRALKGDGLEVEPYRLDVTQPDMALALSAHLAAAHGGLDVLVNNAAIMEDGFDAGIARRTVDANFYGPLRLTERLLPQMRAGGRVVMLSSGLAERSGMPRELAGRFTAKDLTFAGLTALMEKFVADVAAGRHRREGWPTSAYRVSKTGLNALSQLFARTLAGDPRHLLVNAVCPGWVQTAMGGAGATRPVEHGAETPVWAALLPQGGPTGGFFRDRELVEW